MHVIVASAQAEDDTCMHACMHALLLLLAQMMQDVLVCARCRHCTATVCEAWNYRDEQLLDNDKAITSLHAHHSLFVQQAAT